MSVTATPNTPAARQRPGAGTRRIGPDAPQVSRVHLSRCPPTPASNPSPTRTPCPTSGPTGRLARMPASSVACCSSPSRRNLEPQTSTTPPASPSPEPQPRLIVCCSPCAPPMSHRSSHCRASSHRRPHRARRPRPREQVKARDGPGSLLSPVMISSYLSSRSLAWGRPIGPGSRGPGTGRGSSGPSRPRLP